MLIDECGLPAEYLHVVTGGGGTVGNAIVDHPDIALITFTGSPEVGWGIRARAPRKRVGLELGNNAPVIIEPDGDWKTAAAKIKIAGFSHAGQSCISTQRIYVHSSIADDFTAALVDHVNALVVGDPLDEATDVSALISRNERDRVVAWVAEAEAAGAKVLTGGALNDDGVLRPDRHHQRQARHEGLFQGGLRAGGRHCHVRLARRRARAGQRFDVRLAGGDLHERSSARR